MKKRLTNNDESRKNRVPAKPVSSHNVALCARLVEFVEKKGDNLTSLAKTLGLSSMFFYKLKTEHRPINSEAVMRLLVHYPELSAEWLLRGAGTMLVGTIYKDDVDYYHTIEKLTNELQTAVKDAVKGVDKLDKINNKLLKARKKSKFG